MEPLNNNKATTFSLFATVIFPIPDHHFGLIFIHPIKDTS
ncbi:hypothetical protein PMAG_b0139 [Pseudoalteromonas mariniglutinosa NCIMB 1770]|nr:hypothetical protein [Pseudoalteromonas mariniglutinosa NCIMB 1770]